MLSTDTEISRHPSHTHCTQMLASMVGQKHTSTINGKEKTMDHPVSYISGLFCGSQLNWAALTKEAHEIYMSVKKSTFYLTGHEITLRSDHLPLKKFLTKMTLNHMVNNWSTEIESFNINFVHISGKDNVLADTLSRLIDMDPDVEQQPELKDQDFDMCEIQITYDNAKNLEFSIEFPLDDEKFVSLQEQDPKIWEL